DRPHDRQHPEGPDEDSGHGAERGGEDRHPVSVPQPTLVDRPRHVASGSNGGGLATEDSGRTLGVRTGFTVGSATTASALAGPGAASSSKRASRMMRLGSYCRGSSLRQSTSSMSGPISSRTRDLVSR